MKKTTKKIALLIVVLGAVVAVRLSGLHHELTFERLQQSKALLKQFVDDHYELSAGAYILAYVLMTALSIPGATIMTLAGGFLFGMKSVIFVNIGATAGAVLAFLASRYLAGEWVQKKYGERLTAFNNELAENGHRYLLTLRLIPAFPFFLINILSGLTAIPLRTFLWTTAIGILPGSTVYTFAGTQLAFLKTPGDIISKNMLIAFGLLALLALLPVIVRGAKKKVKGR